MFESKAVHIDLKEYARHLQTRTSPSGKQLFCPIRKKWIVLQPEELVRQLFIQYLLHKRNISIKRISVEVMIQVNQQTKRYDLAIADAQGQIDFLLECKSFNEPINTKVYQQIGNYNLELESKYIGLSNGIIHHFLYIDRKTNSFKFLDEFPSL